MSLNYAPQTVTAETYADLFAAERAHTYPAVDALEERLGVALDRDRLEAAARVLSCPFKAAEPNWQHGRVIYAVTLSTVQGRRGELLTLLDIGTAKGFSALCLQWALNDSDALGEVVSLDVLDPMDRVRRNTVAEVDGLKTLHEVLAPWPEARRIRFEKLTGPPNILSRGAGGWLTGHTQRITVAYVDGKHTYEAVSWEASLLAQRQQVGDVIIFDDIQVPGVAKAVDQLRGYDIERIQALPTRRYAIARKR